MIDAFFAFKDMLGGFVSHMEYEIQNTFFAILMLGVVYNQYQIRKGGPHRLQPARKTF